MLLAKQPRREWKQTHSLTDVLARASPMPNRCQLEQSQARRSRVRSFASLSFSYWPSCDNPNNTSGFKLKDNLESSTANGIAEELISITITLISADFKVRKETLYRFLKSNAVRGEFITLEVILKVFRGEAAPIHHYSFTFNTARNASCGISTRPTFFMRFLPSFCFSSSLRLRVMSPP